MDLTALNTASGTTNAAATTNSPYRSAREDFKSLGKALQSGDLSAAKDALTQLQSDIAAVGGQSGRGNSLLGQLASTDGAAAKDLQAVSDAIDSGSVSDAQNAFAQLRQDVHAGGHHHHGDSSAAGGAAGATAGASSTSGPSGNVLQISIEVDTYSFGPASAGSNAAATDGTPAPDSSDATSGNATAAAASSSGGTSNSSGLDLATDIMRQILGRVFGTSDAQSGVTTPVANAGTTAASGSTGSDSTAAAGSSPTTGSDGTTAAAATPTGDGASSSNASGAAATYQMIQANFDMVSISQGSGGTDITAMHASFSGLPGSLVDALA